MKKDIKYIIKRIIIGVLVALIFSLINSKSVFADSLENAYINIANYSQTSYVSSSPWGNGATTLGYFDFNNYRINLSTSNSPDTFYLLFKDNFNYYIISSYGDWNSHGATPTFDSINIKSTGKFDLLYNNEVVYSDINLDFFIPGIISSSDLTNNSIINYLNNNYLHGNPESGIYNNNLYYQKINLKNSVSLIDKYNIIDYFNENLEFVSSSVPIYLNGVEISPNYFQEINLENNQAVFFVPKDYSSVPTFTLNNELYIYFNMYYSGTIRESYFNIANNEQWNFPNSNDLSSFTLEEYTTSFPMFYNNDIDSLNYNALMFNKLEDSNDVIIYYDSRYFNYYFIEDLESSVFLDISFIDRNGNNITATISFNSSLEDYWQQGFDTGGDEFNTSHSGLDKLKNYIDLLKLPFHIYYLILEQVSTGICRPIQLPIPKVGGIIQLDCLSTIFKNVLTVNFYIFIKKCLNLTYLILFTIWNVKYVMYAITPNLEVHTDTGGFV